MTREDAAELLLLNDPWEACPKCECVGMKPDPAAELRVGDPVTTDQNGKAVAIKRCSPCFGTGLVMKPEYIEAHELLDVPIRPPQPNYHSHRLTSGPVGVVVRLSASGEATIQLNRQRPDGSRLWSTDSLVTVKR